jgi:biopolymer transport protein ExbD
MKIKGAKQIHYDSGPNMTPLVDVVMVILIFLMLAGSFERGGWFLQSSVPIKKEGGSKSEVDPTKVPDQNLEIRVDNSGDGFVARIGGDTTVRGDRAQLKTALDKKREMFEQTQTDLNKVQVVLMPGRNVKYNSVILVYEAALRAGFKKVGFATSH